jgi:DNA-binding transcriptional MerR regulator
MSHELFRIGQLAMHAGSKIETIRYYEQQRLLPQPARSGGNYRLYGAEHVKHLQFIRHCRSLDMTLDEIRTLPDFRDTPDVSRRQYAAGQAYRARCRPHQGSEDIANATEAITPAMS